MNIPRLLPAPGAQLGPWLLAILFVALFTGCKPGTGPAPEAKPAEHGHGQEQDLLRYMERFQRFADKLYFAGQAQNWELAAFYADELTENAEHLVEQKLVDDGQDISALANTIFLPQAKAMERSLKKPDTAAFAENYRALVLACNRCHVMTKHAYIVIQEPKTSSFSNQRFTPGPNPAETKAAQ